MVVKVATRILLWQKLPLKTYHPAVQWQGTCGTAAAQRQGCNSLAGSAPAPPSVIAADVKLRVLNYFGNDHGTFSYSSDPQLRI